MPILFLILLAIEVTEPTPSACECRAVGDNGIFRDNKLSDTVTSSVEAIHEEEEEEEVEEDGGEGRSEGAGAGAGAERNRGAGWDRAAIDLKNHLR